MGEQEEWGKKRKKENEEGKGRKKRRKGLRIRIHSAISNLIEKDTDYIQ